MLQRRLTCGGYRRHTDTTLPTIPSERNQQSSPHCALHCQTEGVRVQALSGVCELPRAAARTGSEPLVSIIRLREYHTSADISPDLSPDEAGTLQLSAQALLPLHEAFQRIGLVVVRQLLRQQPPPQQSAAAVAVGGRVNKCTEMFVSFLTLQDDFGVLLPHSTPPRPPSQPDPASTSAASERSGTLGTWRETQTH